jgi:hypothetical protein
MTKRNIPALLLLLAAAACTSTPQASKPASPARPGGAAAEIQLTDAERSTIEAAVRARAGQPSAPFRTIIAQRDRGGSVTVCGYFNPGSGDTPFVGTLSEGAFIVSDIGGPTERTIAVQKACHGSGIYI